MAHIQMLFNVDVLPENEEQKHGKVLIEAERKIQIQANVRTQGKLCVLIFILL